MSLPADYVDLGFAAMHVGQLRKHTTSLKRFRANAPLAVWALTRTDYLTVVAEETQNPKSVLKTVQEIEKIRADLADILEVAS